MKKRLIKLIITSIIVICLFFTFKDRFHFKSKNAFAVGDLEIDWGVPANSPLFVVTNMMPGETKEKQVLITNNATVTRPVGVRGLKTEETGNLSKVLEITISQNGTVLYQKTLSHFFQDSNLPNGIFLFNLNHGQNKTVKFKVKFKESADNSYQNKKVVFDLKIGLSIPIPPECRKIHFDNIIFGTEKNDILKGTKGNDLIFGLEGNDTIDGLNGNDVIFGNKGNDVINGSNGNDWLYGNEGNDTLTGGNGNDILIGGNGYDKADGQLGIDRCVAEVKKSCEL